MPDFSSRLRSLRHASGLSQMELSNEINLSSATIGSWETGRTEPSLEMLCRLADYFGVTVDYLLGRSDTR